MLAREIRIGQPGHSPRKSTPVHKNCPFHVAEKFTGIPGRYVSREDTIRGFAMIVDGQLDSVPEAAFYNAGAIEEVLEAAKKMEAGR